MKPFEARASQPQPQRQERPRESRVSTKPWVRRVAFGAAAVVLASGAGVSMAACERRDPSRNVIQEQTDNLPGMDTVRRGGEDVDTAARRLGETLADWRDAASEADRFGDTRRDFEDAQREAETRSEGRSWGSNRNDRKEKIVIDCSNRLQRSGPYGDQC